MRDLFVKKKWASYRKDRIVFGIFMLMALALLAGQAMAIDVDLFGNSLSIKGYVNQSAQFSIAGDKYDTMQGFQQSIMQALPEFEYYPADNLKLSTTGLLYKDWAYNIYDSDDDWKFRRFNESPHRL